jgi:hypothetical protein
MKTKRKFNNKQRKRRITKKIKRHNKTKKYNKKGSGLERRALSITTPVFREGYKKIGPVISRYVPQAVSQAVPENYANISNTVRRNLDLSQKSDFNKKFKEIGQTEIDKIKNRQIYIPQKDKSIVDVDKIISESLNHPPQFNSYQTPDGLKTHKEPREIMKREPIDITKYYDQQQSNFNEKTGNNKPRYKKYIPNFTIEDQIFKDVMKEFIEINPFNLSSEEAKIIELSEIIGLKDWIEKQTGRKLLLKPSSKNPVEAIKTGLKDVSAAIISIVITKILLDTGVINKEDYIKELNEGIKKEVETLPVNEESKEIILDGIIKVIKDNEDFFEEEFLKQKDFYENDFFAKNSKPTDLETINSLKKRYSEIPEENEEERQQLRDQLNNELALYQAKYNELP